MSIKEEKLTIPPMKLQEINIITNLILTFCLVLFAWWQWLAVEEQNKQNLFRLKIEHFSRYKQFLYTIMQMFSQDGENTVLENTNFSRIAKILDDMSVMRDESLFLFINKIYSFENSLLEKLADMRNHCETQKDDYILKDEQQTISDQLKKCSAAFSEDLYVLRKPGMIVSAVRKLKGNLNRMRTKEQENVDT
ncbi:MAG TPA: hypothetical protein H9673_06050 [Candidatus Adamsella sp.]|nr:hypothetical protein [Candidatus Adamsella sp.]